jgi:Reverse transcriptase (RNA-dependent DNA polymerase)
VRALKPVTIPPESAAMVPVAVYFPGNSNEVYIERVLHSNRGVEDFYGISDSVITRQQPQLFVNSFSKSPVTIHQGQLLGHARNPSSWLDQPSKLDMEYLTGLKQHSSPIRAVARQFSETNPANPPEVGCLSEDSVINGGPKTQELPAEEVSRSRLLQEIDFSPDLNSSQLHALQSIIQKHHITFGLDGRLGNSDAKVEIQLRPGATEVSLPPYNASPAKREVIDKQMDAWLELEVIEPSKSPWGFPVLIVYRNGKARMCIDYRKLNERAVPDEFPLPRQDAILQALTGSQWLTTLDALAGFTQLSMAEDAKEKTAFRTHRGLYQFRCMPFGYRNGPSVFQHVMQNVLAPFLWIFALIYIDDIVIYSKSFKDHLSHLDQVFGAISRSGITLSPAKCHIAFQSLMLFVTH